MRPTTLRLTTLASILLLAVSSKLAAQPVAIQSYSYLTGASGGYPDTGGVELTNGVDLTDAWPTPGFSNTAPLVGWQNSDPFIRFNFAPNTTITQATLWFADSDGAAGVGMPSQVTLTTTGFSQSFLITNPVGSGTTVPVVLSGFSVNTDHLDVNVTRIQEWTMISEVTFAAPIPEPATAAALMGGVLGLVAVGARRRPRAGAVSAN